MDSIPAYSVIRGNVNGRLASLEQLKSVLSLQLHPVDINEIDGLKLIFRDGWLLVRPSGTEPKIRLTVECTKEPAARHYFDVLENIVKQIIEGR